MLINGKCIKCKNSIFRVILRSRHKLGLTCNNCGYKCTIYKDDYDIEVIKGNKEEIE